MEDELDLGEHGARSSTAFHGIQNVPPSVIKLCQMSFLQTGGIGFPSQLCGGSLKTGLDPPATPPVSPLRFITPALRRAEGSLSHKTPAEEGSLGAPALISPLHLIPVDL